MSVYDDGEDIGPATETRGGENPDWDAAEPGKPLKEKPDTPPEPEDWAPEPGWGLT